MPRVKTDKLILEILKKADREMAVTDLSALLGITPMAVRRHLTVLERDGLLKTQLKRQALGRPYYTYSLTEAAQELFPRRYSEIALELLDELVTIDGDNKLEELFKRRKDRLVTRYGARVAGKELRERVAEVVRILNEEGNMAECYEEKDGSFLIKQFNCCVAKVAQRYGHICNYEAALISELAQAKVERESEIAKGGQFCSFRVRPAG